MAEQKKSSNIQIRCKRISISNSLCIYTRRYFKVFGFSFIHSCIGFLAGISMRKPKTARDRRRQPASQPVTIRSGAKWRNRSSPSKLKKSFNCANSFKRQIISSTETHYHYDECKQYLNKKLNGRAIEKNISQLKRKRMKRGEDEESCFFFILDVNKIKKKWTDTFSRRICYQSCGV